MRLFKLKMHYLVLLEGYNFTLTGDINEDSLVNIQDIILIIKFNIR